MHHHPVLDGLRRCACQICHGGSALGHLLEEGARDVALSTGLVTGSLLAAGCEREVDAIPTSISECAHELPAATAVRGEPLVSPLRDDSARPSTPVITGVDGRGGVSRRRRPAEERRGPLGDRGSVQTGRAIAEPGTPDAGAAPDAQSEATDAVEPASVDEAEPVPARPDEPPRRDPVAASYLPELPPSQLGGVGALR